MMLSLIEVIAGRDKAETVAHDLGVETWDTRHASAAFALPRPFATAVLPNRMAFWKRDVWGIQLEPAMGEVSLAIIADAWSRTYRSNAVTFALSPSAIVTANGVRVLPDRIGDDWLGKRRVSTFPDRRPGAALDLTLDTIAARYGMPTTSVVAMQMEYSRSN